MAVRGSGGPVAGAIGIAAGAGAAQLGLGYGLGIIAWLPSSGGTGEATWVANLAWAAWIGATSTVIGALCAQRLGTDRATVKSDSDDAPSRPSALSRSLCRLVLAVAAAVGAFVTVALVAIPARAATRADTFSPQTIAAGHAVVGVVGGLLVAMWALASRAAARNALATVAWLWLLAVVAVAHGGLSGRGLATAQLGVWEVTSDSERFWFHNYFYWPGAALSLGSALVIGALAAWPAARRSDNRVGAAISGGVGPLLVAGAYFLAAPRLAGIRAEQLSAHLMAPYAVIVGLAGSVLVTALVERTRPSAPPAEPPVAPAQRAEPAPASPAEPHGAPVSADDSSSVYASASTGGHEARGTAAVRTGPSTSDAPKAKPRRPGRRSGSTAGDAR